MISRKEFLKILNEKSMTFTYTEIINMMSEELDKPIDKIDTNLIDNCFKALESTDDKK